MFKLFFDWYKRNYKLNLYITAGLFIWQIVHLYWMTTDVVLLRLHGHAFWDVSDFWHFVIAVVDYTEIPAILLATIFYLHEFREKKKWRSILMLILINSQWLHLFWITDEVVVQQLTGNPLVVLPLWLSWMAIMIDYLELPVIYDTIKKAIKSLLKRG